MAAYFTIGMVASLIGRGLRATGIAIWVVTGLGVPALLGLLADDVSGTVLVGYVVLLVLGHLWTEWRAERAGQAAGGTTPSACVIRPVRASRAG